MGGREPVLPASASIAGWPGVARAACVALALLVLAGCGVVPISGPPEGDFGSRSSRQSSR